MARLAGSFMAALVDCLAPIFLLMFFVVSACLIVVVITPAATHPDPLVRQMRAQFAQSMANQTNQGNKARIQGNPGLTGHPRLYRPPQIASRTVRHPNPIT